MCFDCTSYTPGDIYLWVKVNFDGVVRSILSSCNIVDDQNRSSVIESEIEKKTTFLAALWAALVTLTFG